MRWISVLFSMMLGFQVNSLFAQKLVFDAFRQDTLYRSLIDRPDISLVYSQQGIIFSDWLIQSDETKVFAVYRYNSQAFTSHTPLLLFDSNNIRLDSISIRNWPHDGLPQTFPILSMAEGKIAYQPLSIYADSERFPGINKPTKGFVKIDPRNFKLDDFEFSPIEARLNRDFIQFNEKKEEFSIPSLRVKSAALTSLLRFKDAITLMIDKENRRFYVYNPNSTQNLIQGVLPLSTEDKIVNVELLDENTFLLIYRSRQDGFYHVTSFDMSELKIYPIYSSKYFIPRAKAIHRDVYVELSGKFAESLYPESIILKLKDGLP
ncbi:hypothetical protein A3SI_09473 [Nitritalea halalkaliphila LW7]|uniref:Uncharacterized protein n=1 Tax=Nitritalea halalkaliphila LW7 TaxID=1189621 RepID=I5C4C1_9BACT|nr:hypothetical protein [Nitritalea halalkaliphila]EIM76673.1 hypothetical protein A3SI_09473 [Nitritalea halalkaliphila LW7]